MSEPNPTIAAVMLIIDAIDAADHPDLDGADLEAARTWLAQASQAEANAAWPALAAVLGNLPFAGLTRVRDRLAEMGGPHHDAATYWFTRGVWHHRVEQLAHT